MGRLRQLTAEPGARAATTCSAVAFNSWQPGADGTVVRAIMALHRASPSRALRRFLCAVGERPPLALHVSSPRVQAVDRCWCMRSGAGDACTDSGPLWVRVSGLCSYCARLSGGNIVQQVHGDTRRISSCDDMQRVGVQLVGRAGWRSGVPAGGRACGVGRAGWRAGVPTGGRACGNLSPSKSSSWAARQNHKRAGRLFSESANVCTPAPLPCRLRRAAGSPSLHASHSHQAAGVACGWLSTKPPLCRRRVLAA